MKIEHIAIWTEDLEKLKEYYTCFFGGKCNRKYKNPVTLFESYFISFSSGARLELMSRPEIRDKETDSPFLKGLTHIAFEAENKQAIDKQAEYLKNAGFEIVRGPRITGDGYYEFETFDPDGNKIEVTVKNTD